jgi:hypothetical protein
MIPAHAEAVKNTKNATGRIHKINFIVYKAGYSYPVFL